MVGHLSVAAMEGGNWELLVLDASSGGVIQRVAGSEPTYQGRIEAAFKTSQTSRVRVAIRGHKIKQESLLPITRVTVSEIAPM